MEKTFVQMTTDKSRGIDGLNGTIAAAYSDAVRVDLADHSLLFISGKTGVDSSHRVVGRTMREQTRQVLENIKATLEHEGGSMDDVVRVRIYVTQIDSASVRDVHEVRKEYFKEGRFPASTLVRVDELVRDGGLVEIEADVVLDRR